jgi:hypothetical protein
MRRRVCVLIVTLALATACSAPPEKERHQAEGAIAAAREAGAATYAPTELAAAEAALQKYDGAVAQRDYRQALSLAFEARDAAYQAAKRSSDEKAAARSQADTLATDAARLIEIGRTRLASPAGRAAAVGARLRPLLARAESTLQEARTSVEAQDYRDAASRLRPIVEELRAEFEPARSSAAAPR